MAEVRERRTPREIATEVLELVVRAVQATRGAGQLERPAVKAAAHILQGGRARLRRPGLRQRMEDSVVMGAQVASLAVAAEEDYPSPLEDRLPLLLCRRKNPRPR